MRILGVDPGYAIVGCGMVDCAGSSFRMVDYGAITTPAGMPMEERLAIIYTQLTTAIEKYRPQAMSIEQLYFTNNVTTAIAVAQARGVILLCAQQQRLEIAEYTPLQVKQAVVGYGRAEKAQVMEMTRRILKLDKVPKPDDAADALALAICHSRAATSLLNTDREFDPAKYDTR